MAKDNEIISEKDRAEDIILGTLGYAEDASLVSIEATPTGFKGKGRFSDGEQFSLENEEELSQLEIWALSVLTEKAHTP